jgi:hypothetical protein
MRGNIFLKRVFSEYRKELNRERERERGGGGGEEGEREREKEKKRERERPLWGYWPRLRGKKPGVAAAEETKEGVGMRHLCSDVGSGCSSKLEQPLRKHGFFNLAVGRRLQLRARAETGTGKNPSQRQTSEGSRKEKKSGSRESGGGGGGLPVYEWETHDCRLISFP